MPLTRVKIIGAILNLLALYLKQKDTLKLKKIRSLSLEYKVLINNVNLLFWIFK